MRGVGRRQKPDAVRQMDGSRKRPHQHAQPVIPGECQMPSALTAAQRAYWRYYAPILTAARMLTPGDRESLRMYCIALDQIDQIQAGQAEPEYRRIMLTSIVDSAGNEKVKAETNPLDVQLRQWLEVARHHQAELGLSPSSRTRVPVAAEPEQPASALAALQGQIRRVK